YNALYEAYNKAVLRSLFIHSGPLLTAKGEFRFIEKTINGTSDAPVHVYENNVTALPPDLSARRVPLCFVSGMEKGDFSLTLKLNTGESYTFSRLGYETVPFADAVEKQIHTLRGKTLAAVKEIDPALSAMQTSKIVHIMPQGAAAPIGQLMAVAPSFVSALETKLNNTRAAECYKVFRELCDPSAIYIGFRKNETGADSAGGHFLSGLQNLSGGGEDAISDNLPGDAGYADSESAKAAPPDPYLLWLIAPSPDGRYAAVDFAETGAATFVYKTRGDFDEFARQLNRALEAISFRREVIRLSDEELNKPENTDYYMAAKRTASVQFIRSGFAGRVIHSNVESWKRKLSEIYNT
ncbi:MAG: hypothetical protein LBH28_08695, partial [Oscillospiraceae bacterium]|nr:hypothetical protein [Oscillospiraceae bacterium]